MTFFGLGLGGAPIGGGVTSRPIAATSVGTCIANGVLTRLRSSGAASRTVDSSW